MVKAWVRCVWKHRELKQRNASFNRLLLCLSSEAIRDAHLKRQSKTTLGMKMVLSENVRKPRFIKRGTRPLCRTKCIKTLKNYQKLYFEFKARFQEVSAELRQAIRLGCDTASICFPTGGVPLFGGRYSPD